MDQMNNFQKVGGSSCDITTGVAMDSGNDPKGQIPKVDSNCINDCSACRSIEIIDSEDRPVFVPVSHIRRKTEA